MKAEKYMETTARRQGQREALKLPVKLRRVPFVATGRKSVIFVISREQKTPGSRPWLRQVSRSNLLIFEAFSVPRAFPSHCDEPNIQLDAIRKRSDLSPV